MRPHWIVFTMLILASNASAQDATPPTITSIGEASEDTVPTHVEFKFSAAFEESTFAAGAEKANAFPEMLTELLKSQKLDESLLTFRSPHIDSVNKNVVTLRGIIRFALPGATDSEEQVLKFAALCDSVAELAKAARSTFLGPKLIVENSDLLEQETLKRATENALYKADAIAQILNTRIYEVKSVKILEIQWHSDTKKLESAPGLDRLTCTAKVLLTYLHQP